VVWFGQELAWNQYPSNELSSKLVVGCLAVVVIQVWVGTDEVQSRTVISARDEIFKTKAAMQQAGFVEAEEVEKVEELPKETKKSRAVKKKV